MGMERTSPTREPFVDAWRHREWQAILLWPMSGEDKLAWGYLFAESRGRRELISVSGTMVGEAQRTSGDAGRTRLNNLLRKGLILRRDNDRRTGRWLIEMLDPFEVGRAIRHAGDPQREFDFLDEFEDAPLSFADDRPVVSSLGAPRTVASEEAPVSRPALPSEDPRVGPEEPPEVPRLRAAVPPVEPRLLRSSLSPKNSQEPSIFSVSSVNSRKDLEQDGRASGGTSGGSSDPAVAALQRSIDQRRQAIDARQPRAIGGAAAAVAARLPTPAEQSDRAQELAHKIFDRVAAGTGVGGDTLMFLKVCQRVAWAIVEGRIASEAVFALLYNLDLCRGQGRLKCPASAYVVPGFKTIFAKAGVDWSAKQPPQPR